MSKRTKKQLQQFPKYIPVKVPEDNSEDLDIEDYWYNYDGECQDCGIYGSVDEMLLCDDCASKLERDLIRQRNWDYCVSAYAVPGKEREKLRNNVIKKYGKSLELILLSGKASNKRSFRRRKKRNK